MFYDFLAKKICFTGRKRVLFKWNEIFFRAYDRFSFFFFQTVNVKTYFLQIYQF